MTISRPDFTKGNIFSESELPPIVDVIANSTPAEEMEVAEVPDTIGDEHSEVNSEGDKENE